MVIKSSVTFCAFLGTQFHMAHHVVSMNLMSFYFGGFDKLYFGLDKNTFEKEDRGGEGEPYCLGVDTCFLLFLLSENNDLIQVKLVTLLKRPL